VVQRDHQEKAKVMNDRNNNWVETFIEVELDNQEAFLLCKETLTRVGISSNKDKKLYQSCHILHKKGKYYLVHFKELFTLDNRASGLDETDLSRRNTIAKLLHEWGLCNIVGAEYVGEDVETGKKIYRYPEKMSVFCSLNKIKIIPYADKVNWDLISKYTIGKKYN
jgi:hypothetical protein